MMAELTRKPKPQTGKPPRGLLVVLSGPSGVGKSTIVHSLLERAPFLTLSVSYATRAPRTGEKEGVDYFFVDRTTFDQKVARGDFLEWAKVHGNCYGTDRGFVEKMLKQNKVVVLEVDVQGARHVREWLDTEKPGFISVVFIFIIPPSVEILSSRLTKRNTESGEVIGRRMRSAIKELQMMEKYDYIVVNDHLALAAQKIEAIIRVELERKLLN